MHTYFLAFFSVLTSKALIEAITMAVCLFLIKIFVFQLIGYIVATGIILKFWPIPALTAAWYAIASPKHYSSMPKMNVKYMMMSPTFRNRIASQNLRLPEHNHDSLYSSDYRWPYEERPNLWLVKTESKYILSHHKDSQTTDPWIPKDPPLDLIYFWESRRKQ